MCFDIICQSTHVCFDIMGLCIDIHPMRVRGMALGVREGHWGGGLFLRGGGTVFKSVGERFGVVWGIVRKPLGMKLCHFRGWRPFRGGNYH